MHQKDPHLRLVVNNDGLSLSDAQLARVRRQADVSGHLADAGLKKPNWTINLGDYCVECRRGGYRKWDSGFEYRYRSIELRVRKSGQTCATASFVEWNAPVAAEFEDFFYEADAISQEEADFAAVITDSWDWIVSPFNYGTAVRFDLVFIDSQKGRSAEIWQCLRSAIDREFSKRSSVLLLEAIPINYARPVRGREDNPMPDKAKRMAATKRLAARRLGALPMPKRWAQRGWMWKELRYCPEPRTAEEITQDL